MSAPEVAFSIGMVALGVVSYRGILQLEAIKPRKQTRRPKAKRKPAKTTGRIWPFFKPILRSTMKDLLLGVWFMAILAWIYAALVDDLALQLLTSVPIFGIHFYLRSLKKQATDGPKDLPGAKGKK